MHVHLHSPVADPKNLTSAGVFEQGQVFEKIRSLSHSNVSKSPKSPDHFLKVSVRVVALSERSRSFLDLYIT